MINTFKGFKPMKAILTTVYDLPLPCYVGVKFDGIRAVIINGVVLSLTLKPIPNKFIQYRYGKDCYNGLDMEITVGDIYDKDCFRNTTSIVMSKDKPIDNLNVHVFDCFLNPDNTYEDRIEDVRKILSDNPNPTMINSVGVLFHTHDSINEMLDEQERLGGEGLIARKVDSKYKYGRSTLKEGFLYKIKFYDQGEFVVVGFMEAMHNSNEAVKNELGRTSRSLAKGGMIPKGTLGALVLELNNKSFNCGTGFSDVLRQEIWNNKDTYINQYASVRYMKTGIKDAPRHPVFVGFRHKDDIRNDY